MSAYTGNIFNFSRDLPEPFDTLSNKKVKVASKYSDGATASTLCSTVIKAINAICRCKNSTGEGAVGIIDQKTVAEYKSSMGPDAYHLVVYNRDNGNIMASIFDKNTETIENYKLHASERDGAAVMMALVPLLLKDDEFDEHFQAYYDQRVAGYPDMKKATESMAILCDNAYRRIKDDTCSAHLKVTLDKSGNVLRVSQGHLDSGAYTPNAVLAGEFTIFAKTGRVTVSAAKDAIDHKDFVGQYQLSGGRVLSVIEETLVPKLEEWYIIPDQVVNICRHAQVTTGRPMQMRNFLMRGPAGTGKTQGAMAIAAGLHLPYMKYTCSAGTEIFDFIGQVFPNTDGFSSSNPQIASEREMLKAMGGINYANVAKLMSLPDLDDMDYDPAGTYKLLTGIDKEDATSQECMAVVIQKVTEKICELSKSDENKSEK